MTSENDNNPEISKIKIVKDIFTNLPSEISNFKRIPCALNSIYTGIIAGTLTATLALVSTGKLASLRFGIIGYLGSSLASWQWCRNKLKVQQYFVPSAAPSRLYCEMNRIARRAVGIVQSSPRVSNNAREVESKHRSFKEMIQWRKEKDKKDRLVRNKKLMDTLKNDINPRFQLADIRAFTLPSAKSIDAATEGEIAWKDLGLRDDLVKAVSEGLKLKTPFSSQISAIPALMKLKTGLFAAPTGCGKTLIYLLPLFQNLKEDEDKGRVDKNNSKVLAGMVDKKFNFKNGPRALIIVPTHELVRQVYATAKALSHYAKLKVETIDTVFKHKDPLAANSIDILITTPRSLIKNQLEDSPFKIKTGGVTRIIVDEADTLLSADFATEVKQIIKTSGSPEDLRVLATSATITRQLQRTMTGLFPDLKIHMTAGLHAALPALRQKFITINQPGNAKMQQALKIILDQPTSRIMIFCNKLVKAEALHSFLSDNLASSDAKTIKSDNDQQIILPSLFHGSLPPVQRASLIQKFASGQIRVLVCTDLAARGLDTPWVNQVINFDFPRSLQDYLHRAGRTARAGRGGTVTSFVTAKDRSLFEYIELAAKQRRIFSDPL